MVDTIEGDLLPEGAVVGEGRGAVPQGVQLFPRAAPVIALQDLQAISGA